MTITPALRHPIGHPIERILMPVRGALVLLCAIAAGVPTPLPAQAPMVIYRCTDPAGNITLQNDRPCPKGHTQQIRDIGTLPALPAASAPAKPASPAPVRTAPTPPPVPVQAPPAAATPPQAPPALFQCRSWDDRDYLGDSAEPPATCKPLETVGIDGTPNLAAGSACEMRRDVCTAIPAEQLCSAWKRRMDEAEFRWKFAGSNNDERKTDYERFSKLYRDSTCVR